MKMKKLILWVVLIILVVFLIWFVASVLFGSSTYAQELNSTQQVEPNKSGPENWKSYTVDGNRNDKDDRIETLFENPMYNESGNIRCAFMGYGPNETERHQCK